MYFFRKDRREEPKKEQVSVILKRQVPIRHDKPARSWFGGLPKMPEARQWPRDKDGAPLHFLAQICCSDLPAELWGGIGPREGWLLLFVDALKLQNWIEEDTAQVLHIDVLGPEREPPEDVSTMRLTMTDSMDCDAPSCRAGIPKLWRKWPVDLIKQTFLVTEDVAERGAPIIPADELYDGPVTQGGFWTYMRDLVLDRPMTWRGVLYFVEGLLEDYSPEKLATQPKSKFNPMDFDKEHFAKEVQARFEAHPGSAERDEGCVRRHKKIREDIEEALRIESLNGWLKSFFPAHEKEIEKITADIAMNEQILHDQRETLDDYGRRFYNDQIRGLTRTLAKSREARAYIDAACEGLSLDEAEARLMKEIDAADAAYAQWQSGVRVKLKELQSRILAQDMEALLTDADWAALSETLRTNVLLWSTSSYSGGIQRSERGIYTERALKTAVREDTLDLYARGELALPEAQIAKLEAAVRAFGEVPHRMGGFPNLVQGDVEAHSVLLFQIASDVTLGWAWGDAGALYVETSPKAWVNDGFERVDARIEGH